MERTPVISSYIKSVGYDPATPALEIEFKGGQVFRYKGVPKDMADQFVHADSPGKFFHTHIKDRFEHEAVAA